MQDHNDIYSIVERLRMLEEGLDKNQKSVNQLSATFKPKTVAVLTSPKDPKNPMAGKLVGGAEESVKNDEEPLEEAITSEDVLDKVKASFADYLKNVADEIKQDSDLKDKKKDDTDLRAKDKTDRDLVAKDKQPVTEHGTNLPENAVKCVAMENGRSCEIYQLGENQFEIRHGNRRLPTRFKNLKEAEMALEMFMHRRSKQDEAQDYIDEA